MRTPARISIRAVSKIFGRHPARAAQRLAKGRAKDDVQAEDDVIVGVYDITLDIEAGEIFVIMGLSGSGKSTLLRLINRLQRPTQGHIYIDGDDITAMSARQLRALRRRKFGMVFQSFALMPQRTVLRNVEFGLEIQGVARAPRQARARAMLETVGLSGYEAMHPDELSGGMQQRVGLARALAIDPEILLMDEAFSALDPMTRAQLQDDLLEINARLGKTIVFVSHDLDEAIKIGTRIAILRDGVLVQVGTPQDILARPADDYVRAFVEGADRTRVLTAARIMQPLRVVASPKDSPRVLLRRIERSGFGGLIVVDNARRLLGYIGLTELSEQIDAPQLALASLRPLPAVPLPAKLAELIRLSDAEGSPLVVVDERERAIGVIDRSTLLAALARSEPAEEAA